MTFLHLLSHVGTVAAAIFVTLSLASGLLWISELIEEHSRLAKTIGERTIHAIIIIHLILYLYDNLPLHYIVFSIACHLIYLQNFTPSWPLVSLSSPSFLASCVLVVADHFLWFFYFVRITQEARHRAHRSYRGPPPPHDVPGFSDIATFFGICVWLAPLFLFLSLSANDNTLPVNASIAGGVPSTPTHQSFAAPQMHQSRSRASLFKSLYDFLPLDPLRRIRPKARRHDTSDGLIAPHSPITAAPPSPLLAPQSFGSRPSSPHPPRRIASDMSVPVRSGSPVSIYGAGRSDGASSHISLGTPPRRKPTRDSGESSFSTGSPLGLGARRLDMRRAVSERVTPGGDGWMEVQ